MVQRAVFTVAIACVPCGPRRSLIDLCVSVRILSGLQARSKDQEILEEGGGAGPSLLPRRDHE